MKQPTGSFLDHRGTCDSRVSANREGTPVDGAERILNAEALERINDVLIHEGLSVTPASGINIAAAVRWLQSGSETSEMNGRSLPSAVRGIDARYVRSNRNSPPMSFARMFRTARSSASLSG
jgi:cysteine synthase